MDLMQIAQNFGLPVAGMVIMGYFVCRAIRWIGEHVALPLVDAHIDFLQSVQTNLEKNSKALERIVEGK